VGGVLVDEVDAVRSFADDVRSLNLADDSQYRQPAATGRFDGLLAADQRGRPLGQS
jgi:hypothetical protein